MYAVYNTSQEVIMLPKNQIVGRCQLILQPNKGAYLQEMAAIRQEVMTEKEGTRMGGDKEGLSRDWVIDNFQLQDDPIT